jgi:hypothetical protein
MPIAGEPITLLIDGLNVAYWRGNPPSLALPLAVAAALFRHGHRVRLIFDASTPHRLPATQRENYARMLQSGQVEQTPSGVPADRHLLKLARAGGAAIISRDRFRDHRARYRKLIDDPGRLMDGYIEGDSVRIPGLGINESLHNESGWRSAITAEAQQR